MYVSPVCISTSIIVSLLLALDLSLPHSRYLPSYGSTLDLPRTRLVRIQKIISVVPSTPQLPYDSWGVHIPAYNSKYLDRNRRLAQHMS